jgi:integrase
MLVQWREDVKTAARRRDKHNKVISLDNPVAANKWLFPKVDGSVGHPHAFNNFLKRFCKEHKIESIGPHAFQHLSRSYLLN